MAKPWAEVANSDGYKSLPPDQQEAARSQYFDQVVAPRAPQDKLAEVRAQFDAATKQQTPQAPVQASEPPVGFASSAQQPAEPEKKKLTLPEYAMGGIRSALRGMTVGTSDVLGSAAAALATPSPNTNVLDPQAWKAAADQFGTVYQDIKSRVNEDRDQFRQDAPAVAYGSELAGAIAPAVLSGGATLPAASTTLGKVALGAGLGAAQGGVYGASQADAGNVVNDATNSALVGLAVGGSLPLVAKGASALISPAASKNPALQKVLQEGGSPTIGMALGGRANALEEKLTSLPIMGDMINVARKKAVESLEPAAYNRALAPIGQKLPKGLSGRDALIHTEGALKQKYDDVLTKIGAIKPDEQFSSKVSSLSKMVDDIKMPQAQKDKFLMAVDDVKSSLDENGVMTSQAYKELESNLGSIARKLGGSQDIYEGKMAPAVQQLRAELQGMLQRQAGPASKELKAANTAWANFKVIQKAAGGVGAEEGRFSPAQLQSAVRAADKSKDKASFARGNALMQDLSEAGKTVMGSKTGNSFTADRAFMGIGALGSGAINPAIPAGLATGGALYTQPVQKALVALAAKRPDLAPKVAAALEQGSNYLIAPSATGGAILAQ